MKKITPKNYYQADDNVKFFGKLIPESSGIRPLSETDYINLVSDVTLNEYVPKEIHSIFDAAVALYCYGYLYWTFFTLAQEQAFKAMEASVSIVHSEVFGNQTDRGRPITFSKMISQLITQGMIPENKKNQYFAIRQLRNSSFHPESQSQFGHSSVETLRIIATNINDLFTIEPRKRLIR